MCGSGPTRNHTHVPPTHSTFHSHPHPPQTGTLTYEGLWLSSEHEFIFVSEYLGPQLRRDHPDVKLFLFDHNEQGAYFYVRDILEDPVASQFVDGVAFHWYDGPGVSSLNQISAEFPRALLFATEATVDRGAASGWFRTPGDAENWAKGEYYGRFIMDYVGANVAAFIDWNVLLDENGGPDHGDPTGEMCEGLIACGSDAMLIADTTVSPPVVYRQAFYWFVAHSSRWVPPGSVRVGVNLTRSDGSPSPLRAFAFVQPGGGGGTTVVLMNDGNTTESLDLRDGRFGRAGAGLPPHSVHTLVY